MILGERRRITTRITADTDDPFTIEHPSYTLSVGGVAEASGTPDVVEHDLIVTIQPRTAGVYTLEFGFDVAAEHVIRRVAVSVSG